VTAADHRPLDARPIAGSHKAYMIRRGHLSRWPRHFRGSKRAERRILRVGGKIILGFRR
jgi:hypothetical protein